MNDNADKHVAVTALTCCLANMNLGYQLPSLTMLLSVCPSVYPVSVPFIECTDTPLC